MAKPKAIEVTLDPKSPTNAFAGTPKTREELQVIVDRFAKENPEGYARRKETIDAQLAALPSSQADAAPSKE